MAQNKIWSKSGLRGWWTQMLKDQAYTQMNYLTWERVDKSQHVAQKVTRRTSQQFVHFSADILTTIVIFR